MRPLFIGLSTMTDQTKKSQVKKIQKRTAYIAGGIVAIGLLGIYYLTTEPNQPETNINDNKKINYISPLEQVDTQSVVLERTQKQLRDTEKKTEALQQKVEAMIHAQQPESQEKATSENHLTKRIDELEKQIKSFQSQQELASTDTSAAMAQTGFTYETNHFSAGTNNFQEGIAHEGGGMMREDNLTLAPSELKNKEPLKNPDTYVPSGTFVKAVVIGGADAATSVLAQANPKVMLFRIIENGTLPNHRKSHLKDCMVTGKAIGDISSERASIETETLSCVFENNEVVDQTVKAMIFGPDGKVDVRGNVREGGQQYVGRAFAAGTLSGLSDGLSQTYTTNSISPEGNVQTVNSGRIFQYGAAKGAGKAMDKLADYQMRKAEQFHPVIQLSAGTVVDIVFQKGFFLDGKTHEDTDKKTVGNYSDNVSNVPTLFPPQPMNQDLQKLPLSQKAVERIEKYNKELGLRVSHPAS